MKAKFSKKFSKYDVSKPKKKEKTALFLNPSYASTTTKYVNLNSQLIDKASPK